MHLPIKQKKIHDRMSNLFNNPQPKHCPIRAAQNPFNKNPWAVGVAALSLISAAVYLFAPLFSIPIFGFNTGSDYVRVFYSYQRYMDMATFLIPAIGAFGAILCAFRKEIGPHILSVAFAALPLMFMTYFVVSLCRYPDFIGNDMQNISMIAMIGWGAWLALATALLAFLSAIALVYTDYKQFKTK